MKPLLNATAILLTFLLASSCAEGESTVFDPKVHDKIDPAGDLTREDFRELHDLEALSNQGLVTDPQVSANVLAPPVPDIAEIIAAPKPPKIGHTQLVSLAVTDDVPLKDVLVELARLADVDIEVDSSITGGITFRAKDRPFNEVIERIADLAGLRYKSKNGVLRVERDTPYVKIYSLDLLNIDRDSSGSFTVSSTGGGGSGSSGSSGGSSGSSSYSSSDGGTSTGSNASISAKASSDFWKQFEESVNRILNYQPTEMTSTATIATQPAATIPANTSSPAAKAAGAAGGGEGSATDIALTPQQATAAAAPAAAAGGEARKGAGGSFAVINRQASTLTVSATDSQHELIRQFLAKIEANTSSQVLIEAKLIEVALNDRYQSGINWSNFGSRSLKFSGDFDSTAAATAGTTVPSLTLIKNDILRRGIDLSASVRLLNEFGTTRALSSPRLHAINNQQAVLSFSENLVYFSVNVQQSDAVLGPNGQVTTPPKTTITTEQKKAPVGIVLNILPSVNKETDEITLSVRPTLTRLVKFVSDPGFQIVLASVVTNTTNPDIAEQLKSLKSEVPQIETRELDSIMKVKSGETLVIGGLLEDRNTNNDAGVPGVSEVPWVGNLFKGVDKTTTKKELVIFIRATVVPSSGNIDKADKAIYEKFIQDPRPIQFNQ